MTEEDLTEIMRAAKALSSAARKAGVVLTIEQRPTPNEPLAMGNHVDVVSVRPARELADPLARRAAEAAVPCQCGARQAGECLGAWEPGCDLGANEAHVRVAPPEHDAALAAALAQPAAQAVAADFDARLQHFEWVLNQYRDGNCTRDAVDGARAALAAAAPVAQPIGYMSPKQLHLISDPLDDPVGGKYIPMRKTPAGNFTLALYVATPGLINPQDC